MAATKLDGYVARYGPMAGPKLYHALQSRAAYIGANARRRKVIASLTGHAAVAKRAATPEASNPTPMLAGVEIEA